MKAGFFSGATLLDGASMGSGAHVRPGTLLEEQASGAHTVGFKQTVLMSFTVTGSLVNFCDCLLAGGTNRKHHSEVGSSYVHFNFTPHQDKATASLIGDVPRGVMLDQPPIFLGGQGGIVGPSRVGIRLPDSGGRDFARGRAGAEQDHLSSTAARRRNESVLDGSLPRHPPHRREHLIYLGNIRALKCWYASIRRGYMLRTPYGEACYEGALRQLKAIEAERLSRLREFANKLARSIDLLQGHPGAERWQSHQQSFLEGWPGIESKLHVDECECVGAPDRDELLNAINRMSHGAGYIEMIQSLAPDAKQAGRDGCRRLWTTSPARGRRQPHKNCWENLMARLLEQTEFAVSRTCHR